MSWRVDVDDYIVSYHLNLPVHKPINMQQLILSNNKPIPTHTLIHAQHTVMVLTLMKSTENNSMPDSFGCRELGNIQAIILLSLVRCKSVRRCIHSGHRLTYCPQNTEILSELSNMMN